MKRFAMMILAAVLPLSATQAAEPDLYWGIQYAAVTYDEEDFDEADLTALVFRIGQTVSPFASVEGRFGFGIGDDEVDLGPFDAEVEINYLIGVYGLFHTDIGKDFQAYGVLGFTQVELEASILGFSDDESESGLSYGAGVNFGAFNLEYMMYIDDDDYDLSAISLGYTARFD